MSDHKFDRLLSDIRNEKVDDRVVAQASERVWSAITRVAVARAQHAQAAELRGFSGAHSRLSR